jgi:hypothetical protein
MMASTCEDDPLYLKYVTPQPKNQRLHDVIPLQGRAHGNDISNHKQAVQRSKRKYA